MTPADPPPSLSLQNQPRAPAAGATVKIKIRAVNEADPGPFGDEVTVVVN